MIEAEYVSVVSKPDVVRLMQRYNVDPADCLTAVRDICDASEIVIPVGDPPQCRDEKDRAYLHCSVAGTAEYLITRDEDLLTLRSVGKTPIVSPGSFFDMIRTRGLELDP